MNSSQQAWWEQATSDHSVLEMLRRQNAAPCHQLHYLQMMTEKLAKAYFWRSNRPSRLSHCGLVQYLRALGGVARSERERIARALGFHRYDDAQRWIRTVLPIAYELERLAPALAEDGPNPEYPWPHAAPVHVPAHYEFPLWVRLTERGDGRQLLARLGLAVRSFPEYA